MLAVVSGGGARWGMPSTTAHVVSAFPESLSLGSAAKSGWSPIRVVEFMTTSATVIETSALLASCVTTSAGSIELTFSMLKYVADFQGEGREARRGDRGCRPDIPGAVQSVLKVDRSGSGVL